MKKIFFLIAMILFSIATFAQKDVTTFLGIPVDGYKTEMKNKLISKGFTPVKNQEYLTGEFNGAKVDVSIVTNNNKVYRIMLSDIDNRSEADIKTRFNNLVYQFKNNKRYTSLNEYKIDDDVDISYEMSVKNKIFEAVFYQIPDPTKIDTLALQQEVQTEILKKYTQEQIQNQPEEIQQFATQYAINVALDITSKKIVWFRICELYGKYYITMFYDNEYNKANGEDL